MPNITSKYNNINEYRREVAQQVKPTHFLTISLVQGLKIYGPNGVGTWVKGDDVIYDGTYRKFVRCLSKSVVTPKVWKRQKPYLANAGSIEGGSNGERFHLHVVIRKPDHMSDQAFVAAIKQTAEGNPWIMNGEYAVKIVPITSVELQLGSVKYSTKRGLDRTCIA